MAEQSPSKCVDAGENRSVTSDGKNIRVDPAAKHLTAKEADELRRALYNTILGTVDNTAEAKALIERGPPVNSSIRGYGNAPLLLASFYGRKDVVTMLIKYKADLDIIDEIGNTPLIYATRFNKMAIVRELVEAGADMRIRGEGHKTAADWARRFDSRFSSSRSAIADYLINEAPRLRFHPSARIKRGQLNRVKGRSLRAVERDLKDVSRFDDHMLYRLGLFCTGKR